MQSSSRKMKGGMRFVSALMSVVLALGLMPLPAFAGEAPQADLSLSASAQGNAANDATGAEEVTAVNAGEQGQSVSGVLSLGAQDEGEGLACNSISIPAGIPTKNASGQDVVYISISHDGAYVTSDGETPEVTMANLAIPISEIAKIKLSDYDLEEYAYEVDGVDQITVLHLYLYVLSEYYSNKTDSLDVSGGPGSFYLKNGFWGFDENLTYYVNGEYPLQFEGTGSTADQVILRPGLHVDLTHFSSWDFWSDPDAGHRYFFDTSKEIGREAITIAYTAKANEPVELGVLHSGATMTTGGDSDYSTAYIGAANQDVYYGTSYEAEGGDKLGTTDEDGKLSATFSEPGTYYVWTNGFKNDSNIIVTGPAMATVKVEAPEYKVDSEASTSVYTIGSAEPIVFKSDAPLEKFASFTFDGKALEQGADYTAASGSTVITLSDSFASNLTAGEHTWAMDYTDGGKVEGTLTVEEAQAPAGTDPTTIYDGVGNASYFNNVKIVLSGASAISVNPSDSSSTTIDVDLAADTAQDATVNFDVTVDQRTPRYTVQDAGAYTLNNGQGTRTITVLGQMPNGQPIGSAVFTVNLRVVEDPNATYDVTLPTGEGFTVAPAGDSASPVLTGGSYSFTVSIAEGYKKASDFAVKANGVALEEAEGVYTISNIKSNQAITVTGVKLDVPEYEITLPSGTGYTATAAGESASPVEQGGSYSFSVAIADGYEKTADFAVKANDTELTETDGVYTIENIQAAQTITVEGVAAIPEYAVTLPTGTGYTATAANGSTSPVRRGGDYSFTVAFERGYEAGADFAVKANGAALAPVDGAYTISGISEAQTVTVEGVEYVGWTNTPPALAEGVSATASKTIELGGAYQLDLSSVFVDADNDSLTYKVAIDGAETVEAAEQYSYSPSAAGTNTLVFTANDGTDDSTATYTVTLVTEEQAGTDPTVLWSGNNWYQTFSSNNISLVEASGVRVKSAEWDGTTCNVVLVPSTKKEQSFTLNITRGSTGGIKINGAQNTATSIAYPMELANGQASVTLQPYWSSQSGTLKTFNFSIEGGGQETVYDVTLDSGTGYTVTPVGDSASPVANKGDYTFQVNFEEGYKKGADFAVKVNGEPVELNADNQYTISNITQDKVVTVEDVVTSDTVNQYRVTLTEADGVIYTPQAGSASPVDEGGGFSFAMTLKSGYLGGTVNDNGTAMTPDENGIYTLSNISAHHTITVTGVTRLASVTAPTGSTVVAGVGSTWTYSWNEPAVTDDLGDGNTVYYFKPISGNAFFRIQRPDAVTYWNFESMAAGKAYTVTMDDLTKNGTMASDTIYHDFYYNYLDLGDVYLTVNDRNYLPMAQNGRATLNVFRNWSAIESFTNNSIALPDVHYEVVDINGNPSDLVAVTPDKYNSGLATIEASGSGSGMAVVKITYDAMIHMDGYASGYGAGGADSTRLGAIWPECTGVIVVTVGADGSAIDMGMTINTDGPMAHAGKVAGDKIDAEHDLLYYYGDEGAEYTFKPEAGTTVSVARPTLGARDLSFNGFSTDGVITDDEGNVTISGLTAGRNIVKVEKDGVANYQVISVRKITVEASDADGNSIADWETRIFVPGDTIKFTLRNVNSPQEKLAQCYNNAFQVAYFGEETPTSRLPYTSEGGAGVGQYNFSSQPQTVTMTIPDNWTAKKTYSATHGAVSMTGMSGTAAGGHRGKGFNGSGGIAQGSAGTGVLGQLPDLTVNVDAKPYVIEGLTNPVTASAAVGEAYKLDLSKVFADGNDDPLTYTVAIDDAAPVAAAEAYSVAFDEPGKYTLVFTANDGVVDSTGAYTVVLKVGQDNVAPTLKASVEPTATAAISSNEVYSVNLDSIFEDADEDYLAYKVSVNGNANRDASGAFSYEPPKAGTFTLVFTANDGTIDSTDTYTVTLTVAEGFDPATYWDSAVDGNGWVGRSASYCYIQTVSTADVLVKGFEWANATTCDIALAPSTAADATFDFTVTNYVRSTGTNGVRINGTTYNGATRTVPITLADGKATVTVQPYGYNTTNASYQGTTKTFNFSIGETANTVPALVDGVEATAAAEVVAGQAYTLDLSTIFADADDDALTYKVKVDDAEAVEAAASYSFTPEAAGETVLVFAANDGTADSAATYTVTLTAKTPEYAVDTEVSTTTYTIGSTDLVVFKSNGPSAMLFSFVFGGSTLTKDADYTVEDGSTIVTLTDEFKASLAEGEYAWQMNYTNGGKAEGTLTVAKGAEVPAELQLSKLEFRSGSSATSALRVMEPAFDPAVKTYTVIAPTNLGTVGYAFATLADTASGTIQAVYPHGTSGAAQTKTITSGGSGVSLASSLASNTFNGNTITIKVNGEEAYIVNVVRQAPLNTLVVKNGSDTVALTPSFAQATYEYAANIPADAQLAVTPTISNATLGNVAVFDVAGQTVANKSAVTVSPSWVNRSYDLVVTVDGPEESNARPTVYTIHCAEQPSTLVIDTPPTKTAYSPGEQFDPAGMTLKATFADGGEKTVAQDEYTFEPSGALKLADSEIAVSYGGMTAKQPITINSPFEGAGTQDDPFQIKTAADYETLRTIVDSGDTLEGVYLKQMNDITLNSGWTAIGSTTAKCFSGNLDGGNHLLTVPVDCPPLMGFVKYASVKNLNIFGERIYGAGLVDNMKITGVSGDALLLENITLKSGSSTLRSGLVDATPPVNAFGAVSAGFMTTIRNCTVEEGVTVGYGGDLDYIGGLAGRFQGMIENSTCNATVKGKGFVGGIIGMRANSLGIPVGVKNSTFGGSVIATGDYVGGIAGAGYVNTTAPNAGSLDLVGNTVTGNVTGGNKVGGILGGNAIAQTWNNTLYEFKDNKVFGKVAATAEDADAIGGIAGYYRSLNRYDAISNNYFALGCGAEKGIGKVDYVDTNSTTHETESGALYFSTENDTAGCPKVSGCSWRKAHNRTDDPLGADKDSLARTDSAVARIAGQGFATLAGAVAAANDGDTIMLFAGIEEENVLVEIDTGKTFAVDLNGQTLNDRFDIYSGFVTLKDSADEKGKMAGTVHVNGSADSSLLPGQYNAFTLDSSASIEMTGNAVGIYVWQAYDGSAGTKVAYGTKIDVNGAVKASQCGIFVDGNIGTGDSMSADKAPLININDGAYIGGNSTDDGIDMNGMCTVNVYDGATILADNAEMGDAINVKNGALNVYGGTITAKGKKYDPATADTSGAEDTGAAIGIGSTYSGHGAISVNISGGVLTSENGHAVYVGHSAASGQAYPYAQGVTLGITGGQFKGADGDKAVYVTEAIEGDVAPMPAKFISGGLFSSAVDDAYAADTFHLGTNTDPDTKADYPYGAHKNIFEKTDAVAPTFEQEGVVEHWTCTVCGDLFADEAGTVSIAEADTVLPKLGFTVKIGGQQVAAENITVTEAGYDASYEDYMTHEKVESLIPLVTVALPSCAASEAEITLSDSYNAYQNYIYTKAPDATGYTQYVDYGFGEQVDAQNKIAYANTAYATAIPAADQVIRVQTAYDANYNSDNLYAIAFEADDDAHDYQVASAVEADCEHDGFKLFVCKNNPLHMKIERIDALGHAWGEPEWTWTGNDDEGYSSAIASFTCATDDTHATKAMASVLSEKQANGDVLYTATAIMDGKEYTDTKLAKREVTSVKVDFTSQMSGGFLHAPQFGVSVASNLAESYGYSDAVDGTSALDVLVAAHELTFGEDFTAETCTDYLTVSNNNVDMQFGVGQVSGSYVASYKGMFMVNHAWPTDGTVFAEKPNWTEYLGLPAGEFQVNDGDLVEFFFNEGSYMDDRYTWFLSEDGDYSRAFNVCTGEELNLVLKGNTVPDPLQRTTDELGFVNYNGSREIDESQVYTVNLATGELNEIDGAITDSGDVALSFAEPGEYWITSYEEDAYMYPQIMTLTKVTVADHAWGEPEYVWNDDDTKVTATRTCALDATHVETEAATVTAEVTVKPTATAEGELTLTATFANGAFATQTETRTIPAYGVQTVSINLLGQVEKNTLSKVLRNFEVTSEDAAKYGYTKPDAYLGKVTMSDAAAALHREIYGDAFEADPQSYLKISSAGTCTLIFGEPTYMNGFHVNNVAPEYPDQPGTGSLWNDTVLADGDNVRIFKVNGDSYGLMESFLLFDKDAYEAKVGDSVNVTVTGDLTFGTMMGMPADVQPAEYAVVYAVTDFADPEGTKVAEATTDGNGVATLTGLEAGTYHLVVVEYENDYEESCFSTPYATLTVTEHTWGAPEYEWVDDNSAVTAKRVAQDDPEVVQTETVQPASEQTAMPTFTDFGKETLTATFENPAFEAQTKVVDTPKLGLTVKAGGITYGVDDLAIDPQGYDASYTDWQTGQLVESHIPLVTVTLPCNAESAQVALNDAYAAYQSYIYDVAQGESGYIGMGFGDETEVGGMPTVLAYAASEYDAVVLPEGQVYRIQTAYDPVTWASYNLYAIAFETVHDWDEGAVTKAPTISAEGEMAYTCKNDSTHTKVVPLDKLDPASLSDAIAEAIELSGSVAVSVDGKDLANGTSYVTPDVKAALDDAISAAQEVLGNDDSTQENIDGALAAIASTSDAFTSAIKATGLNTESLIDAINAAKQAKDGLKTSGDGKDLTDGTEYVTQDELYAFDSAIDDARDALIMFNTQAEIDKATQSLLDATSAFEGMVKKAEVDDTALSEAIEAAKAIDTSKLTDEQKAELAQAIVDAEAAASDPEATQNGLDAALASIDNAANTAREQVAAAEKAAADAAAAKAVTDMIAALPAADAATAADKDAADAAKAAYDALTDDQKALVGADDVAKLDAVKAAADKAKAADDEAAAQKAAADAAAAKAVTDMIAKLPAAAKATALDKKAADAAKAAYDKLTADQKRLVADKDATKLTAVKKAADNEAANGLAKGKKFTVKTKQGTFTYKVTAKKKVTLVKAKSTKKNGKVTVNKVKYHGVAYKVTAVGSKAFKSSKLKKVTLGSNVKKVGKQAFVSSKLLKAFTVGKNVTKIGANAFKNAKKLAKITVKSAKLSKKSTVKNALKGSKVKTVKLSKLTKAQKKKVIKAFAAAGKKKVTVK